MKKLLSAAVLSFVLFGTASVLNFENKEFEVRDLLSETFTNEKVGRKVNVRRANEVEASVAEAVKVQQRYDSESRTYDFRFVAGINTVEIDKAKITIELGGKKASKEITRAYERIQLGEEEKTAAEVFGEGYDYLLAYVLTDVPTTAVNTAFNVNIDLVSEEAVLASADRDVTFSEIINLDFAPSIEFTNNDELAVVAGSTLDLPGYTLTNSVDTTYTVNITTNGNGVVENGKYTPDRFSETGVHTLTYTAVHPHTGKELVLGHRNVKVAQKILAGVTTTTHIKVNNELTDPVITNTDTGLSGFSFNFDASKYYYVETTMSKITYVNNQIIAMSHNIASNSVPTSGLYYTGFKMNASNYEYAHSKYVTGWNFHAGRMWMGTSYGNSRVEGINANLNTSDTKLAIARAGDNFYYFVNDKLYIAAVYPELQNKDTYPGLIFHGEDQKIDATFSDFVFVRGQENIVNKINSLTGGSTFEKYGRWDSNLTAANTAYNVPNGFTFLSAAQTGTGSGSDSNDTANKNMVSPYVHLYGNWEVNYDVTLNVLGDNGGWGALWTDIRTVHDNFSVFSWRDRSNRTNYLVETEISSSETGTINVTSSTLGYFARETYPTYHVNMKCEVKSNSVETYTITVTSGDLTKTHVFDINYTKQGYTHGSPKYFIFKSQKWAGTISNFVATTQAI